MDIYKAKKKAPDVVGYVEEMLDCDENVASANEYTGLTPSAVMDYEEAENYNDIYDYPSHVKSAHTTAKANKKDTTKSAGSSTKEK